MNNRFNDGSVKMAGGSAARHDMPAIPIAPTTDPFRFAMRTIRCGFAPALMRPAVHSGAGPREFFREPRNSFGRGRVWQGDTL